MVKEKNNPFKFIKRNFYIIILYICLLITPAKNECDRNAPILLSDGTCTLKYCSDEEYENNVCTISNEIIKTQWLTNIIKIGDKDFRYVNFATYSNGDMIVETTAYPGNKYRYFYGLKPNGLPLFDNSYHYIIDANYERNEAVNFVAIINDTQYLGQEYLVSFSKGSKYSELFMFDSDNTIIQKKSSDVFGSEATNFRGSVTKCILDDKIYYVFSFMTTEGLALKRFRFKKPDLSFGPAEKKSFSKEGSYGGAISCFVTEESKYTLCAYIQTNVNGYQGNNYFGQLALGTDFTEKNSTIYYEYTVSPNPNSFVKSIHLKGEVGVFTYYAYVAIFMCIQLYCSKNII